MATSSASTRDDRAAADAAAPRALEPAEVAWLAVLPCAALVVAAIVLLGPPLGHALFEPSGTDRFWPEVRVAPEPVEHARFVLALLAVPIMVAAIVASRRWPLRLRAGRARVLVAVVQVCSALFLAFTLLAQNNILVRSYVYPTLPDPIFSLSKIVVAAVATMLLVAALGRRELVARAVALARETRARRIACALVAVLLVAMWLLRAFDTEHTITHGAVKHLIPWDMSETFAVLNGRTPLVDFHSQYSQLLPYVAAGSLRVLGASVGAWTATLQILSGLALLAVYALLRRLVHGSVPALALFVVFLAGSTFMIFGRFSTVQIYSLWPMRYGGPYLLAWLTARHLDGAAPRRRVLLFGAGTLVALNNFEFGLPALGGTFAALVFADPPRSWQAVLRLARDVVAGALAGIAVVCAVSLLHGGALPHFGLLLEFSRIYGVSGWVLEPMAAAGLHLALYATFVAAIVVATVRAVRGERGTLLTGMLVWSGVFGIGASGYYAGRSDSLNLASLFSVWSLALVLLAVAALERMGTQERMRPTLPLLAVLFGCALVGTGIVQTPRPWEEVARLGDRGAAVYKQQAAIRLVSQTTTPGDKVALLVPLGHRIAFDTGVVDVAPYSGIESIPTVGQLASTLDAMRRAGATQIYLDLNIAFPSQLAALQRAGFEPAGQERHYLMMQGSPPGP